MLLAVWFDTVFRGLQTGSPRTGWGRRRGCAEDRLGRLGGRGLWFPSTSSGQALRDAGRHTTNGGDRRTASEAWLLLAVWFDTVFRGLQTGSPRTGWGRRRGCAEDYVGGLGAGGCVVHFDRLRAGSPRTGDDLRTASESWLLLAVWFDTVFRGLQTGSPRTGWGRRRGCAEDRLGGLGAGGCVVRHASPKTPNRLTTNGVVGSVLG